MIRTFTCWLVLLVPALALAQEPDAAATAATRLAPLIDEQTVAIARLNVVRFDLPATMKFIQEIAPASEAEFEEQLAAATKQAEGMKSVLTTAGIDEIYAVISLADVPAQPPFLVVFPKRGDEAAKPGLGLLSELTRLESFSIRGDYVFAPQPVQKRLVSLKAAPRPEFAAALASAGEDATLAVALALNPDTRRVLLEMLPRVPDEIGGGSGRTLGEGITWIALAAKSPPATSLKITLQAKDAETAAALRGTALSALERLGKSEEVRAAVPQYGDLTKLLTPRITGDRLTIEAGGKGDDAKLLAKVLAEPVRAARAAAHHSQSSNNLKQIGLAMHNHHDVYLKFPPQAIRSKDGKALLSWRVAILPFVGQQALYQEFRLDEPWDSEHNKKLIPRMPAVYSLPKLGQGNIALGKTSYLVPLSKQPPAVATAADGDPDKPASKRKDEMPFDLPQGTKFQLITDGTSNTIIVVEALPEAAVVWTKPDDLVIEEKAPLAGLANEATPTFSTLFGDGSVRVISRTVDAQVLWNLLRMNDGNPIGQF
ncbi:MAG: DUF1559 domain-containing protein [Pirellulaceae bacterium]|jgi:hypothetical protein|nr:DUF1559 domain-containing protein [Pirellulaceae bacterium]